MPRKRMAWTPLQTDRLAKVQEVLSELSAYKPLTLRQIYYQLVSREYIENRKSQYNMLSNLLKWARIDGHIRWSDIEDRVRAFHSAEGWSDKKAFLDFAWDAIIYQYRRNLWQTQDKYIEVWIEKDALSSIFRKVCSKYGVSVVVCRGFSSVSFLHDFEIRLKRRHRQPVMLYFGDFDPSGVEMLKSMRTTLKDELNAKATTFKRIALLQNDISEYNLPHNPDAIKATDTRTQKHLDMYGALAVELDALNPAILEKKITDAIEAEIDDRTEFDRQMKIFKKEQLELEVLKDEIMDIMEDKEER